MNKTNQEERIDTLAVEAGTSVVQLAGKVVTSSLKLVTGLCRLGITGLNHLSEAADIDIATSKKSK